MGNKDSAWQRFLMHEEIVEGLLELAVDVGHGMFPELNLQRMPTREIVFLKNRGNREKAVGRERDGCWRMTWKQPDGRQASAILGIEVQSDIDPAMAVRVAMEDAINYSTQAEEETESRKGKGTGDGNGAFLYPGLPPRPLELAVTLVIYTGKRPWDAPCDLREMVGVPRPFLPDDVPGFQFRLLDLRRVPEKKLGTTEKNSRSVIKYLKVQEDKEALRKLLETDEDYQAVPVDTARVIRAITNASFKIPRNKESVNMCKAEQELCEEARNQGIAKGRDEGIQVYVSKLRRLGVAEEDILTALVEDFQLSTDQARAYLQ